jgi:hypothetical protein
MTALRMNTMTDKAMIPEPIVEIMFHPSQPMPSG